MRHMQRHANNFIQSEFRTASSNCVIVSSEQHNRAVNIPTSNSSRSKELSLYSTVLYGLSQVGCVFHELMAFVLADVTLLLRLVALVLGAGRGDTSKYKVKGSSSVENPQAVTPELISTIGKRGQLIDLCLSGRR